MDTTPRPYQLALLGEAQQRNVIAFLDTGSGKTLISILLMQQLATKLAPVERAAVAAQLLGSTGERNTDADAERNTDFELVAGLRLPRQPKKIIFCVPTVSLVAQQAEKIRTSTDLVVGEYSREDSVSVTYWDALGWYQEMSTKQVLVFTPQIFLNTLRHGFMSLSKNVNLLIFDECHHAWKNHPYSLIMSEFYHPLKPDEDRPKILGMTASPIYQKTVSINVALKQLVELQSCLDCKIVTVKERQELDGYVSKAKEYLIEFNMPSEPPLYDSILKNTLPMNVESSPATKLYTFYVQSLSKLQELDPSCNDSVIRCLALIKELETDLGVWCAGRVAMRLFNSICYAQQKSKTSESDSNANTSAPLPLLAFSNPPPTPSLQDLSHKDITPKVWTLIQTISSRFKTKGPIQGTKHFRSMVFVEKRTTASILCDLLAQLAPFYFPGLSCGYVTGQGSSSKTPDKMKTAVQQKVMDRFRAGDIQLMVVTRVAEEGIDIPACKLIVIFDLFRSNTGYVQSRGRARDVHGSEYILLVRRNDTHALDTISQAKVAEMMTRSIVGNLSDTAQDLEGKGNTSVVTKGERDNAVVDQLVGGEDVYSTKLTTVSPTGFDAILSRYLKKKAVYSVVIEGIIGEDVKVWDEYLQARRKQSIAFEDEAYSEDSTAVAKASFVAGFAYSIQINDNLLEPNSVIYGAVRFTRKSALQSAALEAIRYLHKVGLLNDHLLPSVKSRRKRMGGAFSFSREILEIKRKKEEALAKLEKKKGPAEQLIYDPAVGEGKEDAAYAYTQKVPKCFAAEDLSACEDSQTVKLYATLVSFGPLPEVISPGSCTTATSSFDTLLGSHLPKEHVRSFAFLTVKPIPANAIPDFPIFIESKPFTVSTSNWVPSSSEPITSDSVSLTTSEYNTLKAFQPKLWELVMQNHRLVEETRDTASKVEPFYLIAPMHGHIPTGSDDGVNLKWGLDWSLVHKVVEDIRIPLYDWLTVVETRLKQVARTDGEQGRRKKPRLDSEATIVKTEERAAVLGVMDPSNPIYAVSDSESDSDDEDFEDGEENGNRTEFADIVQSLGLMVKKKEQANKFKRKRGSVVSDAELLDFAGIWESFRVDNPTGSFECLFEYVQRFLEAGRIPVSGFDGHTNEGELKDMLNGILQQALVETSHNKRVYAPSKLMQHMNSNTHFQTDKFLDVNTFSKYFEKLGYSVLHREAPMIEVLNIPSLRNYTRPFRPSEPPLEAFKFLALDVCTVLPVSMEFLRMAQVLPSILHRLQSFCLMDETRTELEMPELTIQTLQQTFTCTSALESYSYERLEILGDAFLKFATSADLLKRHPNSDEGRLSSLRSAVVSNQNLFNVARKFGFGGILVVSPFKPRNWRPPSVFWDRGSQHSQAQGKFSIKRLADFVEALIGCALVDGGANSAAKLMIKFGLLDSRAIDIVGGNHILSMGLTESAEFKPVVVVSNSGFNLEKLQTCIGYTFKNELLARQAMTHLSYVHKSQSYETLEFLGDAVLDWIIMQYLYSTYTTLSPEVLTDLRQAAVNNESFCRLAASIGLHDFLLHTSPATAVQLTSYLIHLSMPGAIEMDPLDVTQEGPKVLGDLFEAIVGAVFVDSGYNLSIVWEMLKPLMSGFLARYVTPAVVSKSPIRQMHEYFQSVGFEPDEVWYL
ncbi:hypothetical protein BDR26DRAFT_168821 [Obelidium mucronatum]|nr:hypothetical protein BDR26DRAFT_168821 [Obelidium mucronatum]